MQHFLSAHAHGADSSVVLARCLEQLGPPAEEATIGFIYATAATVEALPSMLEELQRQMPGVHWLGSVGEGGGASGQEVYDEPALSPGASTVIPGY